MTIKEKKEELDALLKDIVAISTVLIEQGVKLEFSVGSEKKTVTVVAETLVEISCKATVNQEI